MIILNRIDQEVKPILAVPDEDDAATESGPDSDVLYDEDEALEQLRFEYATIERYARFYGI